MRPGIVPEFHDVGVLIERLLDNAALNAAAAAVHQPHLVETRGGSRGDILDDDRGNIARRECARADR